MCREPQECPEAVGLLCVALGGTGVRVSMSECEVGVLRCHSEPFIVSDIGACPS